MTVKIEIAVSTPLDKRFILEIYNYGGGVVSLVFVK